MVMLAAPRSRSMESTRQALVMAGLDLFGEHGFEATSTRMLAERAGANVSAIPYYFNGKEGLYRAVVEYIAGRVGDSVGSAYAAIQTALAGNAISRDEAEAHVVSLLGALSHMLLENDEARSWARIIIKEQLQPSPAFDIVYDNVMQHVHGALCGLIARHSGRDPDDRFVVYKAHTLLGQIFIFLTGRETLLRRLGIERLEKRHFAEIRQLVGQQAIACLRAEDKA
jgi:AcrR family transcriptional regulator